MQYISDFIWGIFLPARAALVILRNPRLWPLVLLPFLVTVVTYYYIWADIFSPLQSSISASAVHALAGLLGVESSADLKSGVKTLIDILLAVFFWIIALLSFSSISNLVTLPVNDFLAEATEPLCTPPLKRDFPDGFVAFLKATIVDLRKSLASIAIMVVTFMFSWIPIMNIAAILLVALALTLQYSGYASTRRGLGVRSSLALCVRTWPLTLGFGFSCMVLLSIPILKLFIPSLAVVAGTMLFSRMLFSRTLLSSHVVSKEPITTSSSA